MCVKLMGQVWPQHIHPTGRKMVLLAFADAANDDGLTWMALESERGKLDMRTKCSMSLRALRDHVAALEAAGYIERWETVGKGCLWRVHATPANSAGVQGLTPAESASPPAESAGEPSSNRQEKENTRERVAPIDGKCPITKKALPAGVSLQQWEAFLDMRASIGKEVRPYVAVKVLAKLEEWGRGGWHAGDILDRSTVNGWADVYEPEAGRVTGVRRVVAGDVAEPVGMSAEDRAELIRIANIENMREKIEARREFIARVERRNAPAALGSIVGELPLRPPVRRM